MTDGLDALTVALARHIPDWGVPLPDALPFAGLAAAVADSLAADGWLIRQNPRRWIDRDGDVWVEGTTPGTLLLESNRKVLLSEVETQFGPLHPLSTRTGQVGPRTGTRRP